jgi:hypothetical protein
MTWLAAMVGPSTVPSTMTLAPFVMASAEAELVPFRYVVEDAVSTVTFWPVDVEIAKPDVDTLSTVPAVPPADGPERALDRPPPGPPCAGVAAEDVPAAEVPEPLPAVALTWPKAPPLSAMAVAPIAMDLVSLGKNMDDSFRRLLILG